MYLIFFLFKTPFFLDVMHISGAPVVVERALLPAPAPRVAAAPALAVALHVPPWSQHQALSNLVWANLI